MILAIVEALAAPACGERPPPHYRGFFALALDQMDDSLRMYPIEEQIEIYLWGMRRHPPLSGLSSAVARNRGMVIPHILAGLDTADSDHTRTDLIRILDAMVRNEGVELKDSVRVLTAVELAISAMRDSVHQRWSLELLRRIREGND